MARTTQGRREAAKPQRGRFARSSTGQTRSPRRFPRSAGQPEQSGAKKLMEAVRGALPGGGGKSSAKSRKPSSGLEGLLSSLGGKKEQGGGRGRKPAIFGLLGAGAAGAAAVAKRRQGRRSSQAQGEPTDLPEAHPPSTAATGPAGDETSSRPDTPAPGDEGA